MVLCLTLLRRSREGAWIEIRLEELGLKPKASRSREGAWIEIVAVESSKVGFCVAPARERGLKFGVTFVITPCHGVAPARERGLKSA